MAINARARARALSPRRTARVDEYDERGVSLGKPESLEKREARTGNAKDGAAVFGERREENVPLDDFFNISPAERTRSPNVPRKENRDSAGLIANFNLKLTIYLCGV